MLGEINYQYTHTHLEFKISRIVFILSVTSRMSHVRFREHMDLSKSISERIAERKRRGEEEAARRRGIAEGLPESSDSHFFSENVC